MEIKDYSVFMQLRNHGYVYNILEGGYIASNGATIIIDSRRPYIGKVMQLTPNVIGHEENIEKLMDLGYIKL